MGASRLGGNAPQSYSRAMSPMLSTVAATIQVSIAPVFLLAGIAGILNVLIGRMARVVDRSRKIEQLHPVSQGAEHDRHVWELRLIDRRLSVIDRKSVV